MTGSTAAPPTTALQQRIVDTIKALSLDAVEKAASGHPGLPMGGADFATVLWTRHLRVDPQWPEWPGRDRFVLSAGHGSMLLYSLLHLAGFDLPIEEIERFRQWGSRTPGHPEWGHTPGVETTTGPLGQGLANGVGMALAERVLAARFPNRPGGEEGHRTFVFASDGDMMEGVASEAASLAGHWKLDNLVVWYDSNDVTIDGPASLAFSEDVGARFAAYGWNVVGPVDGHDRDAIDSALRESVGAQGPSLIVGRTRIAHGSPTFEGTSRAHGAPLGADEVARVKLALGFDPAQSFVVPEEVRNWFAGWRKERRAEADVWREHREAYRRNHPAECAAWEAALADEIPADLLASPPAWKTGDQVPTRKAGARVIAAAAETVPWLVSGSADLLESNGTEIPGAGPLAAPGFEGRNIHYGVREHAMGAIVNGMVLHGGVRAVGATFLVFTDYMRPALRLAALMGIPAVHVLSHDSVHLGEDGPTHQPVEHLDALRVIPNLHVVRPADARETVEAWKHALHRREGPTLIVVTRQKVPVLERVPGAPEACGAGVVWEPSSELQVVLVASGSEVSLCREAAEILSSDGVGARAVSVPCLEELERATAGERERLLPRAVPRLFVEAATGLSWAPWMRPGDAFHGIRRFGASAPGGEVAERLGLDPHEVARRALALLG